MPSARQKVLVTENKVETMDSITKDLEGVISDLNEDFDDLDQVVKNLDNAQWKNKRFKGRDRGGRFSKFSD